MLPVFPHEQGKALHAAGKTYARHIRAAEGGDQAVVPASSGHGALSPYAAGNHLEGGAGIVVQPPHQAMIDLEGHALSPEMAEYRVKVRGTFRTLVLQHDRSPGRVFPACGNLAVQHAQGIGFHAAAAVFTQAGGIKALQPVTQNLSIGGTAVRTAQGVNLECDSACRETP